MLDKWYKKEKPVFTGITRGIGGFGLGGKSSSNWIVTLGGTSSDFGIRIAIDSSDNVYTVNSTSSEGEGSDDMLVAKYDSSGTIQWQRIFGKSTSDSGQGIVIDSSDNVFALSDQDLIKYNSSGTFQSQIQNPRDNGRGIAIDSSDNLYTFEGTQEHINKYNSSGTRQWQRSLIDEDGYFIYAYDIAVDSSGNVYVTGDQDNTSSGFPTNLYAAKFNSSGTLQWKVAFGNDGSNQPSSHGRGIAVDSSDNIYVVGRGPSSTSYSDLFLLKLDNSDGTSQWQRTLSAGQGNISIGHDIAFDSSDNVYVIGNTESGAGGEDDILIAKYNSSGTIQWQRTIGGTLDETGRGIAIDSSDNVYICGSTRSGGNWDILIARLDKDGSFTGNYGFLTIVASSLTSSDPNAPASVAQFTVSDTNLQAIGSPTGTGDASNLTSSFIPLV